MEWDFCCVCQVESDIQLRGRPRNTDTEKSYDKIASTIVGLRDRDLIEETTFNRLGCENTLQAVKETLLENQAVYHHNCVSNIYRKLTRALEKEAKLAKIPCKRSRRSEEQPIFLGENKCLFCLEIDDLENLCAGGTKHASAKKIDQESNRAFSKRLWEEASLLEDSRVLRFFADGTAANRELNYHKRCLSAFHNRYQAKLTENVAQFDTAIKTELHFRKILTHIKEQRAQGTSFFTVGTLEKMYSELFESDSIPYSPHVSRFAERLKIALTPFFENGAEIEIRSINRSVKLCFASTVNEIIDKEQANPATFVQSLMKCVAPIRTAMSKVRNTFNNSLQTSSENMSVPIQLQVLCSLLIDGCDPNVKGFSQCAKTVSQLVMFQYRTMGCNSPDVKSLRRHSRERETPVPIYIGLKIYATVRSKTIIQRLHSLGISISYERILFICNNISLNLLMRYERDGVFAPGNMTIGTFTVIAKDNIDLNARSTKVKDHFHGISMTAMQFPTADNLGTEQDVLYDLSLKIDSIHKLDLPHNYAVVQELPWRKKVPLFMPVCTSNIDYHDFGKSTFERAKFEHRAWLSCYKQEKRPWAEHFANNIQTVEIDKTPGQHSLMPLINEKVSTLKAQYHVMGVIQASTRFLNANQVPIDVSDQPVYAHSKEVQIRYPEKFGEGKYITLLGDLHTEHTVLQMHGKLIKGSGLDTILLHSNLSTQGTSAIVDANDIKRARYCLQVSLVAIYQLLNEAYQKSGSQLQIYDWLDERTKSSEMCFYWSTILNYEILTLMFVRSIREGDLELYLATLYEILPWFFIFDRYKYARWGTIHWFSLVLLKVRCPNEYKEFLEGKFSFQKTNRQFSRIALDQLHEQNNKYIKSVSGATSLINREDDTALIRWELCGPEISRILEEFEDTGSTTSITEPAQQKHHETSKSFRKDFENDVNAVVNSFPQNPFLLEKLTVVNNTDLVFEDKIYYNLTQLIPTGRKQLLSFIQDRLIMSKTSIEAKISLNFFDLPGSAKSTRPRQTLTDKRLSQPFLTKLRAALQFRLEYAKLLFSSEICFAQSLSEDGSDLYHGTKATILQRFEKMQAPVPLSASSAIIIELSPLLRGCNHSGTFSDFASRLFNEICKMSSSHSRVDIICDRYFKDSLKNLTRDGRGQGPQMLFDDLSPLPSKFNDTFLKNNSNKERLNLYLADKFYSFQQGNVSFTVTKGDTILSNTSSILMDASICENIAEEADQKLVRHMIQSIRSGVQQLTVRTVDTDVIISMVSYRQLAGNKECAVTACLVSPSNVSYIDINKVSMELGEAVCSAMPFFYALTGCDIVSSFYNQGKCKFWDRWMESEDSSLLTDVFSTLSKKPELVTEHQVDVIEKFVGFVYYGRSIKSIDLERLLDFKHSTHGNLKLIPPSRSGLLMHIKRAAYYSGWLNYQCIENVELPSPAEWGWEMVNGIFKPKWDSNNTTVTPELLTVTCGCSTDKCSKCRCAVLQLRCLPFCNCKQKCMDRNELRK